MELIAIIITTGVIVIFIILVPILERRMIIKNASKDKISPRIKALSDEVKKELLEKSVNVREIILIPSEEYEVLKWYIDNKLSENPPYGKIRIVEVHPIAPNMPCKTHVIIKVENYMALRSFWMNYSDLLKEYEQQKS